MNLIYLVLADLMELLGQQKALLHMLKKSEIVYSEEEQPEIKYIITSVRLCMQTLYDETEQAIQRLDSYLSGMEQNDNIL
jgi:hypothetical protein